MCKYTFFILSLFLINQIASAQSCQSLFDTRFNKWGLIIAKDAGSSDSKTYVQTDRSYDALLAELKKDQPEGAVIQALEIFDKDALQGFRVLDVGAGVNAEAVRNLRPQVEAYGIDLVVGNNVRDLPYLHEADVRHSGLPSESFQRIFSAFSIFGYKNSAEFHAQALKETLRLLSHDGYLLLIGMKDENADILKKLFQENGVELIEDHNYRNESGFTFGHFLVYKP